MTFSGTNRANVVSLATGQALPHFTENNLLSILSEPAIITLQGAPSQILSFVKQGDDLILHPQNSDAVRYQNFFAQADGRQSELFFRDQGSVHQAMFSEGIRDDAQAIVTLKPAWHLLDSEASLTPYIASTTIVTELPYLSENHRDQTEAADGQTALVSSSVITVDTATTSDVTPLSLSTAEEMSATAIAVTAPIDPLPELTLNPVTGDNAVSYQEGGYGIIFTGTAAHLPSDTPVKVTLNGKTFWGNISQNEWKVEMNPHDVEAIRDGNYTITVSAMDENGNGTSLTQDVLLITHYNSSNPRVTANEVTLASAVQHGDDTWYVLSGTMEMPLPLKSFSVQTDGGFLSENYQGVFNTDGDWSVEMRSGDLHEGNNSLTFGVMDRAGNWFEQTISVPADLTTPVDGGDMKTPEPTIDIPFSDGWLNRAEKEEGQTLNGTTGVTGSGQEVTVIIGGKHYLATVSDDGHWSLPLTPETMKTGFGNGQHGIVVTATDATNHTAIIKASYQVDACPPKIAFDNLPEEHKIALHAASGDPRISGTGETGDIVTVRLGEHQWQTSVTSKGTWAVQLEELDADSPEPGEHTLTASIRDAAGNVNHVSQQVELYTADAQSGLTTAPVEKDSPINTTAPDSSVSGHGNSTESNSSISIGHASVNHGIDGNIDVFGTESSETFSLSSLNQLTSPDNVAGHDTLPVNGPHKVLDFSKLGLITGNVEAFDLGAFNNHNVMPGRKDSLPHLDDDGETPKIKGADGNVVTLSTTEGGVWSEDGQRTGGEQQYDLYHNAPNSHEGSLADVLMQHNLHVQLA